jgi:ArsR family transcriptional regulator
MNNRSYVGEKLMNRNEKSVAIFKALGDMTRIKIIESVYDQEKSVGNISRDIGISQSAISHQLRLLREVDIVRYRQEGKERFYFISDDHVKTIINQVFVHTLDCGE